MADYIVKDTELTSVANAIRTAGGTNSLLSFPNGFVSAIGNIGGGSSDFSTAEVTVTIDSPSIIFYTVGIQYVRAGMYKAAIIEVVDGKASVLIQQQGPSHFSGVFAQAADMDIYTLDTTAPINTSGGVTWDSDEERFIVVGNGSITVSLVPEEGDDIQ